MNENHACMGGWCSRREQCQNYHAEDRRNPIERICEPGRDGLRVVIIPEEREDARP